MKSSGPTGGGDVVDLLQHEDDEIDRLFDEFFSPGCARDDLRRGAVGKELVDRLSMRDAASEEIARTLLGDMARADLAEKLDWHSRQHRRLVGELDDISAGVSPRDLHRGASGRFDGLITELHDLRHEQVVFAVEQVIPTIRYRLSPRRQQRLAADIDRVRRRATTQPGPRRSYRRRIWLAPRSFVDRSRGALERARRRRRAHPTDAG